MPHADRGRGEDDLVNQLESVGVVADGNAGDPPNAEDGEVINADCSVCHTIVAWDEASPEILDLITRD